MHDEEQYAASATIAKTTFFGAQFYSLLKEKALPGVDLVMQPIVFVFGKGGTWEPMQQLSEVPPSTIVVDFLTYVDPRPSNECSSVGYTLCALVSIRTHPTASPNTSGALAGPAPFTGLLTNGHSVSNDAAAGSGATIHELFGLSSEEYRNFRSKTKPFAGGVLLDRRPLTANKYVEFPLMRVLTPNGPDGAVVKGSDSLEPYAFAIADAVNVVPPKLGIGGGVAYYAYLFDKDLSNRINSGTIQDSDASRIQLLGKFRDLEVKFLQTHDADLVKILTTGSFAKSIAAQQVAEVQAEKQQKAASSSDMMATLSLVSATLSSTSAALAARAHDTSTMTQANNQANASMLQALSYKAKAEELREMNAEFSKAYTKVGQEQVALVMTIAGVEETVRAGSLGELREKFKTIYERVNKTM
jgi:hypothetical protein